MEPSAVLDKIKRVIPDILTLPSGRIWLNYDDEADVLYISFEKPQHATDSEQIDDFILHYRGEKLVGVTVVNARKTFGRT